MSTTDTTRTGRPEADPALADPFAGMAVTTPAAAQVAESLPGAESVWGAPPPGTPAGAAQAVGAGAATGRRRLPELVRTKVAALMAAAGLVVGGAAGVAVGHTTGSGATSPAGQNGQFGSGQGGPGGQGGQGGFGGPPGMTGQGQQGTTQQGTTQQGTVPGTTT